MHTAMIIHSMTTQNDQLAVGFVWLSLYAMAVRSTVRIVVTVLDAQRKRGKRS